MLAVVVIVDICAVVVFSACFLLFYYVNLFLLSGRFSAFANGATSLLLLFGAGR